MNLERFDKEFSVLLNFFKKEGFYKNPSEYEKSLYAKLLSYNLEIRIITSRLEEEIARFDSLSKAIFQFLENRKKPDKVLSEKLVMALATIMLDLSDFYIYTRMFLDALTMGIKYSFRSAGNKKWNAMENSVKCLLNKKKLQIYMKEIDFNFFEGVAKKVSWIRDFKKSRDKIVHFRSHLVFATTRKGKLGYDVVDANDTSWGRDTVRGIFEELQKLIDGISDLMEYLSGNLPRTS